MKAQLKKTAALLPALLLGLSTVAAAGERPIAFHTFGSKGAVFASGAQRHDQPSLVAKYLSGNFSGARLDLMRVADGNVARYEHDFELLDWCVTARKLKEDEALGGDIRALNSKNFYNIAGARNLRNMSDMPPLSDSYWWNRTPAKPLFDDIKIDDGGSTSKPQPQTVLYPMAKGDKYWWNRTPAKPGLDDFEVAVRLPLRR